MYSHLVRSDAYASVWTSTCPERNLEVQEMTLKVQMELQEELSRQLQVHGECPIRDWYLWGYLCTVFLICSRPLVLCER